MKKLLALCLALMASIAFAGPVSYYGKLQAKNSALYSANTGDKVQLKGMSMFWDTWDVGYRFYKTSVVKKLVDDWKIEIIRVAHGTGGNQNGNWKSLDETVIDAAIANDIYVIIDYHSHNANNETVEATEFFKYMAAKYGSYPNVIFEIFNEPLNENMWSSVKGYANEIIPVIRNNGGSDNLIVVGNSQYSSHPEEVTGIVDPGKNYAVTFHFYAYEHGVSDGAYNGYENYQSRVKSALDNGMTVFVTEWGTTEASGAGNWSKDKSNAWMSYLDSKKISWCNWSVSDKDKNDKGQTEVTAIFSGKNGYDNPDNWNVNELSESAKYVYGLLQSNYETAPWKNGATPTYSSSSVSSSNSGSGSGKTTDMIDDFEDNDKYAFTGGVWYAYDDSKDENGAGGSTITNTPDVDEDGVPGFVVVEDGQLALKGINLVQGANKYAPYVALGLKLNKNEADYDLSSCKSISYKFKGAEHNFKVQSSKITNYNYHKTFYKASADWKTVNIDWADLTQENWGEKEEELYPHFEISTALKTINKFAWEVKGPENADKTYGQPTYNYLYIDDVKCDGMAIEIVSSEEAEKAEGAPASSNSGNTTSSNSGNTAASSNSNGGTGNNAGSTNGSDGTIDDFEDGDNQSNAGGYWFAYTDKDDKGASSISNAADAEYGGYVVYLPGTNGSTGMAGLTGIVLNQGGNKYDPYVALGVNMTEKETGYNLASCSTISYDYMGAGHNFKAIMDGDGKGGLTEYNRHLVAVPSSSTWTTKTISWSDLQQDPTWGATVALDKSKIAAFHWEVKTTASPDYLYVDNFRCAGATITAPNAGGSTGGTNGGTTGGSTNKPGTAILAINQTNLQVAVNGSTLSIAVANGAKASVQVFDMMGHVIKNKVATLSAGTNNVSLQSLAQGSYLVRVRAGSSMQTVRVNVR